MPATKTPREIEQPYRARVKPGAVQERHLPGIFGVPSLRDHQIQAIRAGVAGRNVFNISPTGSGKMLSIVGTGLILGGITLIIIPLISLAQDFMRRLREHGIPARYWNSQQTNAYREDTIRMVGEGRTGIFITTPESLRTHTLTDLLIGRVNFAAVDEVHCVEKDKGFRTSFSWLGTSLDKIRCGNRAGFTATLTREDRSRVMDSLHMRNPFVIIRPVARCNLVIHKTYRNPYHLIRILDRHQGESGIIFCATRRATNQLHSQLASSGHNVGAYHGGMKKADREQSQREFMADAKRVIICTDAFLLGIDHPHIRFVVHWDLSASIEAWAQGFGRAGRDGGQAHVYGCFMAARDGIDSRKWLLESGYPSLADMRKVWDYLLERPYTDKTAAKIGEIVLGASSPIIGAAIINSLKRREHNLVKADVDPDDKRKRRYRAIGNFDDVDFDPFFEEHLEILLRFKQLVALGDLPDERIASAIDSYFGDDGQHGEPDYEEFIV